MNFIVLIIASLLVSGCSAINTESNKTVQEFGYATKLIQGLNFAHTVFENQKTKEESLLHIYLGGDGTPWFEGRYITDDPTPLNPVMLRLMELDKKPAIYVSRPCYYQLKMPSNCKKLLWTNERYSKVVIESMALVINKYIKQKKVSKVKLFGFSGGGTIAMLLAPHVSNVDTVVTLAGNLDIESWTIYHGYLPLSGSLNPAKQNPLPIGIKQIHFAAKSDKNIPSFIIESVVSKQKNAEFILLPKADHNCCWAKLWPSLLDKLTM